MLEQPARPALDPALKQRLASVLEIASAHADAVDRDARFPHEAIDALREARLLGAMIPRELGGEGASFDDIAELCSSLGRCCSSAGMIFAMHQIKAASLVSHGIASDWHRDFMRRLVDKQYLLGSATTEAGIGGDLRNSICAMTVEGDEAFVEKDATVISYGLEADAILLTARRAPDAASSDQVMVVIERGQATLVQTSTWDTLGMRGTCSHGFKLSARVRRDQIFPKPFAEIAAQSMLAASHLFWASLWFGIAAGALGRAQSFVRTLARKNPTGLVPGSQRLVEATAQLSGIRSLVRDGLARFERAMRDEDELNSMGFALAMNSVKLRVSTECVAVVQAALTINGILGYKNANPFSIGRSLRDVLSAPLMIANDRIIANSATLMSVSRLEQDLEV